MWITGLFVIMGKWKNPNVHRQWSGWKLAPHYGTAATVSKRGCPAGTEAEVLTLAMSQLPSQSPCSIISDPLANMQVLFQSEKPLSNLDMESLI